MNLWRIFVMLSILGTSLSVSAQETPIIEDTPAAACEILKNHMAKIMQLPGAKPHRRWFCDFTSTENEFLYIIGLRSDPSIEGHASATVPLIGWFAVARRSTVVLQFDIVENRVVPISKGYYKRR